MKEKIALIILLSLSTYSLKSQVHVNSSGNVGIGNNNNPSSKLHVEGTTRFSAWTDLIFDWTSTFSGPVIYPENNYYLEIGKPTKFLNKMWIHTIDYYALYQQSDRRAKEKIDTLEGVINKLNKINSYTYEYKDQSFFGMPNNLKLKFKQKKQFGFIAQEIEKVFPELVNKPDSGMMSVNYVSMVPILTQAIKEQQVQISTLKNIVYSQENEINLLNEKLDKLIKQNKLENSSESMSNNHDKTTLMQNIPNPFLNDTEIKFFISNDVVNAKLIIHDMQGFEIKSYSINERGLGSKIINGQELKPGMYLYSLVTDSEIIDTKRMTLTSE